MDLSLFLAKLMGVYMLIVAAGWLFCRKNITAVVKDLLSCKSHIFMIGLFDLIFGLAIAIGHPIWQADWKGLITLLGWVLIVRGVVRFAFTTHAQKWIAKSWHKNYWLPFIVLAVLGAYLAYHGFYCPYCV